MNNMMFTIKILFKKGEEMKKGKREEIVVVRLSKNEKEQVIEASKKRGDSLSELVRDTLIDYSKKILERK